MKAPGTSVRMACQAAGATPASRKVRSATSASVLVKGPACRQWLARAALAAASAAASATLAAGAGSTFTQSG